MVSGDRVDDGGSVERLVKAGLDFCALGHWEEAARCWREALAIDPADSRPREYLALLGEQPAAPGVASHSNAFAAPEPPSGLLPKIDEPSVYTPATQFHKAQLEALLRDKRYEEALRVLYELREVAPDNGSVARAIDALKGKLEARYARALGDASRVPRRAAAASELLAARPPSADEAAVLGQVDGVAATGDIVGACPVGRLSALRALSVLVERGVLTFSPAAQPSAPRADDYADLFDEATTAYLRRDFGKALELFRRCRALRPNDRRVAHNVERLEGRMSKS